MKTPTFLSCMTAALLLLQSGCATSKTGAGLRAGMTPDDVVNGMTRDQVEWLLGPAEATEGAPTLSTSYYTVDGQRWQYVFESDTLTSYGPAN